MGTTQPAQTSSGDDIGCGIWMRHLGSLGLGESLPRIERLGPANREGKPGGEGDPGGAVEALGGLVRSSRIAEILLSWIYSPLEYSPTIECQPDKQAFVLLCCSFVVL